MSKVMVYALLATTFIVFFVLSPSNKHGRRHDDLSRRLGHKSLTPIFDPLVAEMELKNKSGNPNGSENKVSNKKEDFMDEAKLNITLRLLVLFPLLDQSPKDGLISFKELHSWITRLAMDILNHRTQKELESYDKNGDREISFPEYFPHISEKDLAKYGTEHGEAGWWKAQFDNADADLNGSLNFHELKDFLHPEDSNKCRIHKWLLSEKMKRMDYEGDGKLNFAEILEHVYSIYKNYVEFEAFGACLPTAEETFVELDRDNDKFLTVEELIPMFHYFYPRELSWARHYSTYLIQEADDNKDGKLTIDEMLNHDSIFYKTVYNDSEDYDDTLHDEL